MAGNWRKTLWAAAVFIAAALLLEAYFLHELKKLL